MRQRIIGILAILGISAFSHSQNFEQVDALATFYPSRFANDKALASQIGKDFKNPEDQLRAAYTWLIHNVAYDPDEYLRNKLQYRFLEERNQKMAASREEIIQRAINEGVAVCEGYALSLERICELLAINVYVVRGDVKRQVSDIERPFKKSHMWVVAIIGQKPILLDPTWGAGRYDGTFIKKPSYDFYNVPPSEFLRTHYPEVFDDAYVNGNLSKEGFAQQPLLIKKNIAIDDISPQRGLVRAKSLKKGTTFSVKGVDASAVSYSLDYGNKEVVNFQKSDDTITFDIVSNTKAEALVIYFDDAPVLGYKIK